MFLSALQLPGDLALHFLIQQSDTLAHVHLRLKDLFLLEHLDCVRTVDFWLPNGDHPSSEPEFLSFKDFLWSTDQYTDIERLHLGTNSESYSDVFRPLAAL